EYLCPALSFSVLFFFVFFRTSITVHRIFQYLSTSLKGKFTNGTYILYKPIISCHVLLYIVYHTRKINFAGCYFLL
ncbi:unnamed protein product, partial [Arabidopsis halleri]